MALSCLASVIAREGNQVVMNKAVFLDRDGVINRSIVVDGRPFPPRSKKEFTILPGVYDGLQTLRSRGYLNIIVTNQPDIASGLTSRNLVQQFHDEIKDKLPIDKIYMCDHASDANCSCRKPKTGMIDRAMETFDIDLSKSVIIGDRWKDIECGHTAGITGRYFIDYNYEERRPACDYLTVSGVYEASKIIN